MSLAADKVTLGLTSRAKETLRRLMATELFPQELDAALFAMAVAMARNCPPGEVHGAETKWNVGTIDPTNEIRELVSALYPSQATPYRLVEHFMNEGLGLIEDETSAQATIDVGRFVK